MATRKDYGPQGCAERGVFLALVAGLLLKIVRKAGKR